MEGQSARVEPRYFFYCVCKLPIPDILTVVKCDFRLKDAASASDHRRSARHLGGHTQATALCVFFAKTGCVRCAGGGSLQRDEGPPIQTGPLLQTILKRWVRPGRQAEIRSRSGADNGILTGVSNSNSFTYLLIGVADPIA